MRGYRSIGIVIACYLLSLTACNSLVKVRGKIVAASNINPNIRDQASPVVVKIFQLKSIKKFNSASYLTLTKDAKAYLGSDLIQVESIIVRPKQTLPYKTDMSSKTKYIGIVGAFREKNQTGWKATHRVSLVHYENIRINITGNTITIGQPTSADFKYIKRGQGKRK